MVFSSSLFLAYFLPFFFITYYFIEAKYKNIVLFLFSICFYTFGCFDNLYYVLILILSLIINFSISLFIENSKSKFLLIIALVYNFSILFIFKYFYTKSPFITSYRNKFLYFPNGIICSRCIFW